MVFTSLGLFFGVQNRQLIQVGSNGWSSTNVAILVFFFSVYMTKLYETQASQLSIVTLLHDYSFFIIIINTNLIKHLKKLIG